MGNPWWSWHGPSPSIERAHLWFCLKGHVILPHFRDINTFVDVSQKIHPLTIAHTSFRSQCFRVNYSPNFKNSFMLSCSFGFQQEETWVGCAPKVHTHPFPMFTILPFTFVFHLVTFIFPWGLMRV